MVYELKRLGSDGFEKMIQALMTGIYGPKCRVYGAGPDGQREAVIDDPGEIEVVNGTRPQGRTIVQAKFKSSQEDDWKWLRKQLKAELDKFRKKQSTMPEFLPKTYLFFVNIVLTPPLETGIKDKADKFVNGYTDIIPNIYVLGADEIRTLLENNVDVAASYNAFITPGAVLSDMQKWIKEHSLESFDTLIEYASQCFNGNHNARMEHTGNSEKKIHLRKVYTDMVASERNASGGDTVEITAKIIELGDKPHHRRKYGGNELEFVPAEFETANIVLLGGAGHGKSTLCQYICQIYTAAIIRRFVGESEYADDYTERVKGIKDPACERFPMLVKLKDFTEWRAGRGEEDARTVAAYLVHLINRKNGGGMTVSKFKKLLKSYSWIFLFDGLDEVPFSANRSEVVDEIKNFVQEELPSALCDAVVVATSRPQGYNNEFNPTQRYRHFELQDMPPELCEKYFTRLLEQAEENPDNREKYASTLSNSLKDTLISKLMRTPLHTAIIVMIVMGGGTPPTRRYELFNRYCELVIRREQQKKTLPDLTETDWKRIHARLGLLLQKRSENAASAAAELPTNECIKVIEDFYRDSDLVEHPDPQAVYKALTERIGFIAEAVGESGELGISFTLRSMQEFFAAEMLNSIDASKLSEILEAIGASAYWRNVFLFVAGYYAADFLRYKHINKIIVDTCAYCNAEAQHAPLDSDLCKTGLPGSWLALDLLCEDIFRNNELLERCMRFAAELLELKGFDSNRLERFAALPPARADAFVEKHLSSERVYESDTPLLVLWILARSGNASARSALEKLAARTTPCSPQTIHRLLMLGIDELGENAIEAIFRWCTESFFTEVVEWTYGSTIDRYINMLKGYKAAKGIDELPLLAIRQLLYMLVYDYRQTLRDGDFSFLPADIRRAAGSMNYFLYSFERITRDDENMLENKASAVFENHELYELAAFAEYIQKPDHARFMRLLKACCSLDKLVQPCFVRQTKGYNRLLEEAGEGIERGESMAALEGRFTLEYYNERIDKIKEVYALINARKSPDSIIAGLIETGMRPRWSGISANRFFGDKLLDECLEAPYQEPLFPELLWILVGDYVNSASMLGFAKKHAENLWKHRFGGAALLQLMYNDRKLPEERPAFGVPTEIVYYWRVRSISAELAVTAEACFMLSVSYPEAAALLVPLLCWSDVALPPLTLEHYRDIKATGNSAALFGAVFACLLTDTADIGIEEVSADLKHLLEANEEDCLNYICGAIRRFTLNGVRIVLDAAKSMELSETDEKMFHSLVQPVLLEKLEARPVPENVFECLNEEN